MRFIRTLLATSALMAFFALSLPSFAQEQDQDRDRAKPAPSTMTGCLTRATDQWVLTDSQSGTQIVLMGANFDKHANHTVKVTGAPSEDGKSFSVAKIEHVSATCNAPK